MAPCCVAIKMMKNGWQWGPPPPPPNLLQQAEQAAANAAAAKANVRRRQREWETRRHGLAKNHRLRDHPPGWRPPSTTKARRPLPGL